MERIIFHIDVNNAFLSWTAVDLLEKGYKEDIRNEEAVICYKENRNSIILAKSPPAKKKGVVSAEPLYLARKKCPNLKTYEPNYKMFSKRSNELFSYLYKFSPDIEVASIDECYLDYGKVKNIYGDEKEFAYKIKDEIYNKLGFTVNIGIANNKLCAKMASNFEKPNKVHTLYDYEIKEKMYPLPIEDLFGVGKQTALKLKNLGIKTISDLAEFDLNILKRIFKNHAKDLIFMARGIDTSPVNSDLYVPKGISNEITFEEDINDVNKLDEKLFFLSNYISERLRKEKKYAYVVSVILKDNFFKRKNHQKKLKNPINTTNEIYRISKELLREIYKGEYIRLIGIRLDDLTVNSNYQTSFFENSEDNKKDEKFDMVVDQINKKYNKKIITRASYIDLKNK